MLLRGALGGGVVALGVPLLDIFLDGNGTALASGRPMPVRFGTYHWGCGYQSQLWVPSKAGTDFEMPAHLKPFEPIRKKVAILSGFNVNLDGSPNQVHTTGNLGIRNGDVGYNGAPSFDTIIAGVAGAGTRFRSLETNAMGTTESLSTGAAGSRNPSEPTPLALYTRVFGDGFQDPNSGVFTPDPKVMVRQSILSAVKDDRKAMTISVGAADRARLDQYFTSVRQLEQQLALQLEKPAPIENFAAPKRPADKPTGTDIALVVENNKAMVQILALALASNQTKIFNHMFSNSASNLRKAGDTLTHHEHTHEELDDVKLGYQTICATFAEKCMQGLADLALALDGVKEGDRTLLDNTLLFAHSDTSHAKLHQLDGIPMMVLGNAGGKVKTGMHIAGNGDPATRAGLTMQMAMGVPTEKWGAKTMQTNRPINELFA
jgi:hypothetical protein